MKYISRFISDLLYGNPAFGNLKWTIIEDIRNKTGYYKMKKIPLNNITKYSDILTHKRRTIEEEDFKDLWESIHKYNKVIDKI